MDKDRKDHLGNNTFRSGLITYGLVVGLYVVMQVLMRLGAVPSLIQGMLVPLCMYVVLAVSLNLTVGILGELSLGHAGFMCVGAFASAVFSLTLVDSPMPAPVRFALAILVGALAAALFGMVVGIPVLRLRGDYLAIVTLAFGEIVKNVINVVYLGFDSGGFHISLKNSASLHLAEGGRVFINGAQGLKGTPQDSGFTAGFILVMLTLAIVLNLVHSRSGRAIMAIRDNRIAAESIGINVTKYKLMAFTISAALAGTAGALYSHNFNPLAATPKNFGYNQSIMILVFVVLGGIGNIRGSVIAALVLTLLPELLRGLSDYRMLIYAIILIVMMIFNWSPSLVAWRERYLPRNLFGGGAHDGKGA
ncbi:MAG: branched-chain amino acid ABC transporter permease [Lachnospiraceae bacterium]|nr:branched-chain amino acid ABC transporter permease [Lachnospiraceae bacterium]